MGNLGGIEQAIVHGKAAEEFTPEGHLNLPDSQQSLAMSYGVLFSRCRNPEDLEAVIHFKQISVNATPNGHPKLPSCQTDLVVAYTDRRLEDMKVELTQV